MGENHTEGDRHHEREHDDDDELLHVLDRGRVLVDMNLVHADFLGAGAKGA
ncbi:hypothetical protein D3C83_124860 [compost metagenome]